jgi:hypothetical protein
MLSISATINAQRGRHYDNYNRHYSNNNYNQYRSWHYSPVRFRSYNNSYYSPYYRPHVYRPVYRLPHFIHFGPAFGIRLSILPFGYNTIYIGRSPYYYHEGVYYRPYSNGGYQVTAPPVGAEVSQLPEGATVRVIDGQKFYELGGTFYEEFNTGKKTKYRVVGTDGVLNTNDGKDDQVSDQGNNFNTVPANGTRIDELPSGTKTVVLNNEKYYLSGDGVYYREVIENNKVRYEVSGSQAN